MTVSSPVIEDRGSVEPGGGVVGVWPKRATRRSYNRKLWITVLLMGATYPPF